MGPGLARWWAGDGQYAQRHHRHSWRYVHHHANRSYQHHGLLTLGNGCPPVKRPGFKIMFPCGPISPATAAELAYFISLFGGKLGLGLNGGVPGLTNAQLNALGINPPAFPPGSPPPPPNTTHDPNNVVHTGTTFGTLPFLPPPPPLPPPLPPCIDCIGVRPSHK
jgi:hypothetical protein